MRQSPILIQNVYVMLAYAFGALRHGEPEKVGKENFENLHDLLSEILIRGVNRQVKRGLFRDYLPQTKELTTVRGRIDVTQTLTRSSHTRGRLICQFDEYLPDVPHNRVLKSVIALLIKSGEVQASRRKALHRLLPYLEDVTLISPSSIQWKDLHYHQANASYRMLLGVCELIVRGMLPNKESGNVKLGSWLSEEAMSTLYERFLRQFFTFHYPEFKPSASKVNWDYNVESAVGTHQLPAMRTDLTLRHGSRTLIIDAKYYSKSMQRHKYGSKSTIHSGHLYQVLSYVKNQDVHQTGHVSGLLLYAQTNSDTQPALDMVVQGNRIGAQALNLNTPWPELRSHLDSLTEWLKI